LQYKFFDVAVKGKLLYNKNIIKNL